MDIDTSKAVFQLIGSRISKIAVSNGLVAYWEDEKTEKKIDVDYNICEMREEESKDELFTGVLRVDIGIRIAQGDGNVNFDLSIEGCFEMQGGTLSYFKDMVESSGVATLYSIARAVIMSVSSQISMGQQIIIPLLNARSLQEIKNKDSQDSNEKNSPSQS